jgi:hypothetical protein
MDRPRRRGPPSRFQGMASRKRRPRRRQCDARGGGVARRIMSLTNAAVFASAGAVIGGGGAAAARCCSAQASVPLRSQGPASASFCMPAPTALVSAMAARQAVNGRRSVGAGGIEAKLGVAAGCSPAAIALVAADEAAGLAVGAATAAAAKLAAVANATARLEYFARQPFICLALMTSWGGTEGRGLLRSVRSELQPSRGDLDDRFERRHTPAAQKSDEAEI